MASDSVVETFAKLVEYIAKKFLRGEVTLADLLNLDDKEIEVIFLMGHYLYNYGKYQAALNVFSVLTLYKPFVSRYWRAAGAANQALKKYNEAVVAYDMALTTNLNDVISYTYRGESKISAGLEEEGIADLKMATEVGQDQPFYAQWVNRATTLLRVRGITA
jgi:type III secretion system low calcium response chaperone LcrH/SycD